MANVSKLLFEVWSMQEEIKVSRSGYDTNGQKEQMKTERSQVGSFYTSQNRPDFLYTGRSFASFDPLALLYTPLYYFFPPASHTVSSYLTVYLDPRALLLLLP